MQWWFSIRTASASGTATIRLSDDKVSEVVRATGRLQICLAVAKGDRNNHQRVIELYRT